MGETQPMDTQYVDFVETILYKRCCILSGFREMLKTLYCLVFGLAINVKNVAVKWYYLIKYTSFEKVNSRLKFSTGVAKWAA